MSWLAEAWAIFAKEWRCELRTRYALNTVGLFAFTTLVTVSLTVGPVGSSEEMRPILPTLLWLVLLFAASAGLPRTFVHEEETKSADALRLAADPSALFCGKVLYNLSLIVLLEILVVPLFLGMLGLEVASPVDLLLAMAAGGAGLAVGSTLIAAIVGQARARGPLFAVLAFPVLLPLLKLAIDASLGAVLGEPAQMAIMLSFLYDSMLMVAGLMLFPAIWNP
ncbi:MAG: heme exporter protein CcmB [Acidobacteriota bacterium]